MSGSLSQICQSTWEMILSGTSGWSFGAYCALHDNDAHAKRYIMMMSESGCRHHNHYHIIVCMCTCMHAYIRKLRTYIHTWIWVNTHTSIHLYMCMCRWLVVCLCARTTGSSACISCDAGKYQSTAGVESVCVRGREGGGLGKKDAPHALISLWQERSWASCSLSSCATSWLDDLCVCVCLWLCLWKWKKNMHILPPYNQSLGTYLTYQRMDSLTNPSYILPPCTYQIYLSSISTFGNPPYAKRTPVLAR